MRVKTLLSAALIAGMALSSVPMLGCAGEAGIAYDTPPPLREETVTYRPGYVWIHGRWDRDNGRWAWRGGHYERERAGKMYVEGRWRRDHDHYVWVNGTWRDRG
ncbi:MAG TPA: YXWGXW repeat-containing protein [Kofleriaceae bacterium]|nr:YXWGXW repeat-containing protein [Kofleriaceae bacterium]